MAAAWKTSLSELDPASVKRLARSPSAFRALAAVLPVVVHDQAFRKFIVRAGLSPAAVTASARSTRVRDLAMLVSYHPDAAVARIVQTLEILEWTDAAIEETMNTL